MSFATWLHHLFNPHCPDCKHDAEDAKVCESCEVLKMQLSLVNQEKQKLLEHIMALTEKPTEEVRHDTDTKVPVPKAITWNVRRQMLEAEDRAAAKILAENKKRDAEIAKLEKELDIPQTVSEGPDA
jgi:hypothetical protein